MATVRALTSFATGERSIHAGQEVHQDDPYVLRYPSLFSPDGVVPVPDSEPVTADAPEKPKAAAKKTPAAKKAAPKADG